MPHNQLLQLNGFMILGFFVGVFTVLPVENVVNLSSVKPQFGVG